MIILQDLESHIFNRIPDGADELIVISGFVGHRPTERCIEMDLNTTVVYGMISSNGILRIEHERFIEISNQNRNLSILYSTSAEIHTKCYVWRNDRRIIRAYGGSANFTWSGLNTPGRELLVEVPAEDYESLNAYIGEVINGSRDCTDGDFDPYLRERRPPLPEAEERRRRRPQEISPASAFETVRFSLLDRRGAVQTSSGLNWGFADANVRQNDACIPIRTHVINNHPGFFPPRSSRGNEPVELIWDDGIVMTGFLEGSQRINNVRYPKQISSHPHKDTLGLYFRNRLGILRDTLVVREHLDVYGRTDVEITLLRDGSYYIDFSS